jgi:hypothetical protein
MERGVSQRDGQGIVKDIDGVLKTKDGQTVFTELKNNDDHDTGKLADIKRNFIKTWAGLTVYYHISPPNDLFLITYYLMPQNGIDLHIHHQEI